MIHKRKKKHLVGKFAVLMIRNSWAKMIAFKQLNTVAVLKFLSFCLGKFAIYILGYLLTPLVYALYLYRIKIKFFVLTICVRIKIIAKITQI